MSPFTERLDEYRRHISGECIDPHTLGCECQMCKDEEIAIKKLEQFDPKSDTSK